MDRKLETGNTFVASALLTGSGPARPANTALTWLARARKRKLALCIHDLAILTVANERVCFF